MGADELAGAANRGWGAGGGGGTREAAPKSTLDVLHGRGKQNKGCGCVISCVWGGITIRGAGTAGLASGGNYLLKGPGRVRGTRGDTGAGRGPRLVVSSPSVS